MMVWLWSLTGVLGLFVIVLLIKIHILRKAAGEISDGFADRLRSE